MYGSITFTAVQFSSSETCLLGCIPMKNWNNPHKWLEKLQPVLPGLLSVATKTTSLTPIGNKSPDSRSVDPFVGHTRDSCLQRWHQNTISPHTQWFQRHYNVIRHSMVGSSVSSTVNSKTTRSGVLLLSVTVKVLVVVPSGKQLPRQDQRFAPPLGWYFPYR